jgi:hypothetical protein
LLDSGWTEKTFSHMAILPNGDQGNYEHRTSLGGLITTLAEIKQRNLDDLQPSLHSLAYKHYQLLLDYQDDTTHLWYSEKNEVASMPFIIKDLLIFGDTFGELDKILTINLAELKTQVEAIFKESKLIDIIAEIITKGLSTVADSLRIKDITEKLGAQEEHPREAGTTRTKKRKKKKK